MRWNAGIFFLCVLISFLAGCSASKLPAEIGMVEKQDRDLSNAGAGTYLPDDYRMYRAAIRSGMERVGREESRFAWFRDYTQIAVDFKGVLKQGEGLGRKLREYKDRKADSIGDSVSILRSRVDSMRELSEKINEGKTVRKDLIKAELLLAEAEFLKKEGAYGTAEEKLRVSEAFIGKAEDAILPIFSRYSDGKQIRKWQSWVAETISESKVKGISVIIINKSERSLTVYKKGVAVRTYAVGLGRNGSVDKLYAGDNATPEGRYRIMRKVPDSRYHKALLINYPNEEDRRQFLMARRKGLVPRQRGIGGLIEIHGGGKDSMTYGCISLENKHIDELFAMVETGTPVTIVGAVDHMNRFSEAIRGL